MMRELVQHSLYRIRWIDAFCTSSPWRTRLELKHAVEEEARQGTDTIGFFVEETGGYLIFAAGIGLEADPPVYFNGFAIPTGWVKDILPIG